MKILLATDEKPNSGGIINFVVVLANLLKSLGHDVTIGRYDQKNYDLVWIHSLSSILDAEFIARNIKSEKILFHIHDYRYICLTSRKAQGSEFTPCHKKLDALCFANHLLKGCGRGRDPLNLIKNYHDKKKWLAIIKNWKCTVLSKYLKQELILNGLHHEQIDILPHIFQSFEEARFENNTNEIRLLWAGRLVTEKGTDRLIDLLDHWRDWPENLKIRIVGAGDLANKIKFHIKKIQLEARVTLVLDQSLEEMPEHFAWADALLFTSLWPEPFGMIGPEALSAGLKIYYFSNEESGSSEWYKSYQKYCVKITSTVDLIQKIKDFRAIETSQFGQLPNRTDQLIRLQQYLRMT